MKLLAIESSTESFSVAINISGKIYHQFRFSPKNHSKKILSMIENILVTNGIKLSQLDAIAFGAGPGAFTGVRIATSIAQGLAFAADLPVIPISSLAALAQRATDKYNFKNIIVAVDARMNQVYWGGYKLRTDTKTVKIAIEEAVSDPETVNITDQQTTWLGIGSGWNYNLNITNLLAKVIINDYPDAEGVAKLAAVELANNNVIPPEQAMPVYLRNKVALKKHEQPNRLK
jgi:tRNA threonylcarbamoyladenosine biosynthesis protein TsaB